MSLFRKTFLFLMTVFFSSTVQACTVCFKGDPHQMANKGLRAGVVFLLGIVFFVLSAFAIFFIQMMKRTKYLSQG